MSAHPEMTGHIRQQISAPDIDPEHRLAPVDHGGVKSLFPESRLGLIWGLITASRGNKERQGHDLLSQSRRVKKGKVREEIVFNLSV